MMHKRTITLLGAGAILDFDFKNMLCPTTSNITNALLNINVQGLDVLELPLIRNVFNMLYEKAKYAYLNFHPDVQTYEPNINFEELFDAIESLESSNTVWLNEGHSYPMMSGLVSPNLHYESIEYYRALVAMIEAILEIVNTYNDYFAEQVESESWYRFFWKRFDGSNDIFNLNYDTTIETSLENDYNDGFIPFEKKYDRFSPKLLIDNPYNTTTVNHLHGCVLYADANPFSVQYEYSHRDLYKFKSHKDVVISRQYMPTNQAKEDFFYSPIITGLKKTDKICYLPHSIYHCNFTLKILDNPSLLVVGYSFGDIYVNQLLERHKLIHGDNQRVIIVDKYPKYTNREWQSLYWYLEKNASSGFSEFLFRQLEKHNLLEASRDAVELIGENTWQAKHGRFRLYTGGFKDAVINHIDEIQEFLQ